MPARDSIKRLGDFRSTTLPRYKRIAAVFYPITVLILAAVTFIHLGSIVLWLIRDWNILWGVAALWLYLVPAIWLLMKMHDDRESAEAQYRCWGSEQPVAVIQRLVISPEIDRASRETLIAYLNECHPGWSLGDGTPPQ